MDPVRNLDAQAAPAIQVHLLIHGVDDSTSVDESNLIRNLLQDWVTGALSTRGVAEKACKQHRLLLQAIQNHDVASARTAMQEHLHAMAVFLLSPKDHVEEKRSR